MKIKINPQNFIVYLFFFSLNFETLNTFNFGIDFLITKITVSLLILFSLLRYRVFFSLKDYSKYFYPIIIYFMLLVVVSYLNRNSSSKRFFNVAVFLNLLIFIILSNYSTTKPNIILKGLFVFAISTVCVSILYFLGVESNTHLYGRHAIFGGNANDIGIKLSISLFILLSIIFENRLGLRKTRYFLFIFFPFLVKFMVDTGSRVAFVSFFLGVIIIFILYIKNMEFTKKVNLLILGGFLTLLAVVILLKNDILIKRLHDVFSKGDFSNRGQLWSSATHIISKNLFIGVGETGLDQRMGASPHNVFLEVFACTGIIGFLIFIIFFSRILIGAFKKYKYQNELLPFVLFIPVL